MTAQSHDTPFPRITPVGLSGMLVTFADTLDEGANRAALAFRAGVETRALPGVLETSTSLTSAFVVYDPLALPQDALRGELETLLASRDWPAAPLPAKRKLWHIPASFEGEDAPQLAEIAAAAGMNEAETIAALCAAPLRVLTIGFAPGQPYLGTLPPAFDIPRQTGLTPRVPVGAITVAIRQIVLFAVASPTGWRQAGRCAFRPFQQGADLPTPLSAGDEVRFAPVTDAALRKIEAKDTSGMGGADHEALP